MTVDLQSLRNLHLTQRQVFDERDTMLYALSVGVGADPLDERQLRFVYEEHLQALPTMAITLAYPRIQAAYEAAGVNFNRVLHGEQAFSLARTLPVAGAVVSETRVLKIVDKGRDRGLVIYYGTDIADESTGERICSLVSSNYCRDDGGIGVDDSDVPAPIQRYEIPSHAADMECDLPTLAQTALFYRLNRDWNPLHALPEKARQAGFSIPPLHGRCTFAIAGHAVLNSYCDYDARRVTSMSARFAASVYPGETIRTEMWRNTEGVLFRSRVVERNLIVLDNGFARLAG